jgi:hypothetical protein
LSEFCTENFLFWQVCLHKYSWPVPQCLSPHCVII